MCMREADDDAVRVVVSRTPVPPLVYVLRADLYHAVGDVRPDEDMPVAARTYIWVDLGDVIPAAGKSRRRGAY